MSSERCTWKDGKCDNVGRHQINDYWVCTDCLPDTMNTYIERIFENRKHRNMDDL